MKGSPNREQTLFLIAGGIILVLILAVVIFNMVKVPEQMVEELAPKPLVTVAPAVKPEGTVESKPTNWDNKINSAPVFEPGRSPLLPLPSSEVIDHPGDATTRHEVVRKPEGMASSEPNATPPPSASSATPTKSAVSTPVLPPTPRATVDSSKGSGKATPTPAPTPQTPLVAANKAPPAKAAKEPSVAPSSGKGSFVVVLGSYSDEGRANSVEEKATALGLPTFKQGITVKEKLLFRVRAGPFSSRGEAEKSAALVKERMGMPGEIRNNGQ